MATDKPGGPATRQVRAVQRARSGTSRQLRKNKSPSVSTFAPALPKDAKEPVQRRVSQARQLRTVKQNRGQDALRIIDIDIDIDIDINDDDKGYDYKGPKYDVGEDDYDQPKPDYGYNPDNYFSFMC
jgi:hypothetical protein